MAVIINELEVVVDPDANAQKPDPAQAGGKPEPGKPPLAPLDLMAALDREQRNRLRVMAH